MNVVDIKKDPYDIYIGRPTKWGNPFKLNIDGDRFTVVNKYAEYIKSKPDLMKEAKNELRGKTLGCFCAPLLCHGHILWTIANEVNI